jgi:hypothetical protein
MSRDRRRALESTVPPKLCHPKIMGHDPGGFRVWWRVLTGSDETLENAYLMRLAGRFSRHQGENGAFN